MIISANDKRILRELAIKKAELAALPVQKETKRMWKKLNALEQERPMFIIDQIPWHQMDVNNELRLQCENEFCRNIEKTIRRELYKWNHMRDDMVIRPVIDIKKEIEGADYGINKKQNISIYEPGNPVVGQKYYDQLKNENDLLKIKYPDVRHNQIITDVKVNAAMDIFDGILEVRPMGISPNFPVWDYLTMWRGVDNLLYDLVDRPEFIHKTMKRITSASISILEQLERKKLLGYDQDYIHCSGAFTDELPAQGFNPEKPRSKDLWTCGMAQIFSTVSPAMHKEFEIEYAREWYKRFGLVYYGCCEPLHRKIDIVSKIPNLRKISMSPWVNVSEGAEAIGGKYVFSRKPNPAYVGCSSFDREVVKRDLEDTMSICSRYGCNLEFILKDISTVRKNPERLWEWADIAASVTGKTVNY